jgi:N-dimethylarginine dimethylaminohydrolase
LSKQRKEEILTQYPKLQPFIEKLERKIQEHPERGIPESVMVAGQTVICRRQAVALNFFEERYAIGYHTLVAAYVNSTEMVVVLRLYFY